ncbi:CobW/P47K family domain containing protein [Acanthamoeba castellanii str. Neff]|uniref:CobW/P47K family domain containing protein n=1 Tax=Acanthamoeba castellanii (strain ATCC 30010 / Neff) TaxID=1257118 RepID=L8H947_ACACF|nr:CobW/P47K family domain containing protein [Acanthamoeba castellanii str. Neff]ELR21752.1 CobW/P47K family domain containing protein [Acanthamoeba castellanii str. Neff]
MKSPPLTEQPEAEAPKAIPVTVLTGYLGSGKTTLLRRLLHQHAHTPLRLAVIENEFATSGIGTENELREDAQHAACRAQIIETSSGCLCCSAGGKDFKRVLAQLVDHRDKFDHVIIETTGLADPAFAATFFKPNEEIFDKWIWKNCEVDDWEYEGESDGHTPARSASTVCSSMFPRFRFIEKHKVASQNARTLRDRRRSPCLHPREKLLG